MVINGLLQLLMLFLRVLFLPLKIITLPVQIGTVLADLVVWFSKGAFCLLCRGILREVLFASLRDFLEFQQ